MKFYLSLVISLLAHLILLGLLSETRFSQQDIKPVFYVDIAPPLEARKDVHEETAPLPLIKEEPLHEYPRPVPPVPDVMPETMFGKGDSRTVLEEVPEPETIVKVEAGSETKTLNEGSSSEKPEDGFYLAYESSLFNREKIKQRADGSSSERQVISFDTSDLKYRGYMRMLKEQLESIWRYPEEAARLGISGDLMIRFEINKDGTLGDMELIRPSGYRTLDIAAMKAIEDSFPFWPLPDDWEGDEYAIDGHFVYVLGNVQVW